MYNLDWFEFMKFRENSETCKYKVVIYGHGVWDYHMMDWRGCNFWHGRLPGSPVFSDEKAAFKWLKEQVGAGKFFDKMNLPGHHAGEYECRQGCDSRELGTVSFTRNRKSVEVGNEPSLRSALGLRAWSIA